MEIRNLLTFIKVAEEQSLSKAAQQLGYAQSTVTMQMQQLEQEMGISLYERVGRQIRITQEGQELLTYAAQIVKTSQEALQIGKGEKRPVAGTLRLGISDTIEETWLAKLLHCYAKGYPEVQIRVRSADRQSLIQMLLHNEIDLMMTVDHRLTDLMLVHGWEKEEQVHFVAAPDHPLVTAKGQKEGLTLKDILEHHLIRGDLNTPYERDLEAAISELSDFEQNQMEIDNRMLQLNMVLYQDGVTLVPDQTARPFLEDGRLVKLDYELPGAGLWQQTLYHKNKWMTGAMNAWIKMLGDVA